MCQGKKGGRGFTSIEDSVDVSIQGLELYIKKSDEGLITVTRNSEDSKIINRTTSRKQK